MTSKSRTEKGKIERKSQMLKKGKWRTKEREREERDKRGLRQCGRRRERTLNMVVKGEGGWLGGAIPAMPFYDIMG